MARMHLAAFFVLALLVVTGVLWFTRSPERGDAVVATAAPGASTASAELEDARARDSESLAAREEAGADPAVAAASTTGSEPRELAGRWIGRVVDTHRMPVRGATISVRSDLVAERTATTGSDGRFEIGLDASQADGPDVTIGAATLFARGPDGAIASGRAWFRSRSGMRGFVPPQDDAAVPTADFGTVVLEPPCSLDVTVARNGNAIEGARVEIQSSSIGRMVLATTTTGATGSAHFDALPSGPLNVSAIYDALEAHAMAYLPDDANVALVLESMRDFEVEVVDAASQVPIAGARISVQETYPMPARFDEDNMSRQDVYTTVDLEREPSVTGADGVARVERLPGSGRFSIAVAADGYVPLPDPKDYRSARVSLRDPNQVVRVELRPVGGRSVSWPIVAGEVPVPADGSTIALRFAPGSGYGREDAAVPAGRMAGATLVVDGFDSQGAFLAEAPDGSLARLWIAADTDLGKEASFRRPRKIEVSVRDAGGAPVLGASAVARNQGNNALCDFVRTDPGGRATLTGLHGELAEVYVYAPGNRNGQVRAGSVDLEQGDGAVEAVLPTTFFARAVVRIDGVPRLPAKFTCGPLPIEELPERGELRFELVAPDDGKPVQIWLRAAGYASTGAKVAPTADGSEALAQIDLTSAGELVIDVRRAPGQRVEILAERFDEQTEAWGPDRSLGMFNGISNPNGPGGGFRIAGLSPGRWRAIDKTSGIASNEVEITPSALRAPVVLDIATVQWVTGRVEVPVGESLSEVVVLVEGLDADPGQRWKLPGEAPPTGTRVAEDGSFKLSIPGDRDVTLRPWHAWLSPAEGSVVKTRTGLDGLVLKLAPGRELRIPAENVASEGAESLRIAAWSGESDASQPHWIYAPIADGVARTADLAPGRWSLWIDAGKRFAPITRRDVEIGDGVTTLAPLELSPGSSIRVRIHSEGTEVPPRLYVSATSLAEPKFWRDVNSRGESEVVLPGLSAGRYSVRLSTIMGHGSAEPREIEVDGTSDVVLDFTP